MVTWKGFGRPSSCRAIASPSSTIAEASKRAERIDDLGDAIGDVGQVPGEDS